MHNLDFTTGEPAIAYRGDLPWHGYGFEMPENAPVERWLEAARLDWEVERRGVSFEALLHDRFTKHQSIPNMRALVRNDTGDCLSVVSSKYKVVQPREVLEFFRDLTEDKGFDIETAGALAGGKRVWALAKTGQGFTLGADDSVQGYLLLATSYDKQFATTAQFTSVRVVCNNTLSLSLNIGDNQQQGIVRIPHCTTFDPSVVKVDLGLLEPAWEQFGSDAQRLANTPVTKRQAIEYFMELMGYEDEGTDIFEQAQSQRLTKKLLEAYETAPGSQLETSRDTAWGLVNGVTYFADHSRRARDNGSRLNSSWFGQSATLKRKAFDKALELAEAA